MSAWPSTTAIALAPAAAEPQHVGAEGAARSRLPRTGACHRLVTMRGGPSRRRRQHRRPARWPSVMPTAGQGDGGRRPACPSMHEGDVDGPLVAAVLAELVGAVERVDDPDPVVGAGGSGCRAPPRTGWRRRAGPRPAPWPRKWWAVASPSSITCQRGTPPAPARRAARRAARRPRSPGAGGEGVVVLGVEARHRPSLRCRGARRRRTRSRHVGLRPAPASPRARCDCRSSDACCRHAVLVDRLPAGARSADDGRRHRHQHQHRHRGDQPEGDHHAVVVAGDRRRRSSRRSRRCRSPRRRPGAPCRVTGPGACT